MKLNLTQDEIQQKLFKYSSISKVWKNNYTSLKPEKLQNLRKKSISLSLLEFRYHDYEWEYGDSLKSLKYAVRDFDGDPKFCRLKLTKNDYQLGDFLEIQESEVWDQLQKEIKNLGLSKISEDELYENLSDSNYFIERRENFTSLFYGYYTKHSWNKINFFYIDEKWFDVEISNKVDFRTHIEALPSLDYQKDQNSLYQETKIIFDRINKEYEDGIYEISNLYEYVLRYGVTNKNTLWSICINSQNSYLFLEINNQYFIFRNIKDFQKDAGNDFDISKILVTEVGSGILNNELGGNLNKELMEKLLK